MKIEERPKINSKAIKSSEEASVAVTIGANDASIKKFVSATTTVFLLNTLTTVANYTADI
jgi:hypothetical protein